MYTYEFIIVKIIKIKMVYVALVIHALGSADILIIINK